MAAPTYKEDLRLRALRPVHLQSVFHHNTCLRFGLN